ncbi:MAG: hypothetical protein E7317_05490, partial [Clostridiales bacterium]|nr:hypothetical protein [Clostridiales bacterium]
MKKKHVAAFAAVWTVVVAAVVGVWCTLALAGSNAPTRLVSQSDYDMIERYRRLEEVRSSLANEYYIPLDDDALMLGAIRGMLTVPDDPYTFYYTAEEMQRSNESSEGVYHGVGMVVQMTEDGSIEIV